MLADTLAQMRDDGVRRALAFVTSAYGRTRPAGSTWRTSPRPGRRWAAGAPVVDKLRHFHDHPGFVEPLPTAVRAALATWRRPAASAPGWSSPPTRSRCRWPRTAGPEGGRTRRSCARPPGWSPRRPPRTWRGTWCGRAGPARRTCRGWSRTSTTTWPALAERGHHGGGGQPDRVRLRPPGGGVGPRHRGGGARPSGSGCGFARAATPGTDPRFVAMVRELVSERLTPGRRGGGWVPCRPGTPAPATAADDEGGSGGELSVSRSIPG